MMELDRYGVVRIKPKRWLYPGLAPAFLDRIYKIEAHTDAFLVFGCIHYTLLM